MKIRMMRRMLHCGILLYMVMGLCLEAAYSPTPQDGATEVPLGQQLSWLSAGSGPYTYNVYFGTDPQDLALVSSNQSDATFNPSALEYNESYYWKIEQLDNGVPTAEGVVWSFTTIVPVCDPPLLGDLTGDCYVSIEDLALLASDWLTCNLQPQDACNDLTFNTSIEIHDGIYSIVSGNMVIASLAEYESDSIDYDDSIHEVSPNIYQWQRTFSLKDGQSRQAVRLTMDLVTTYQSRYSMIPGISYNGNQVDQGNVYKGFFYEDIPFSFAWHRTTVPGATYSEGLHCSVALFGKVNNPDIGLACSLIPGNQTTTHRLIFPEEERPKRIVCKEYGLSEGRANTLELSPGQSFVATAYMVLSPMRTPRNNYKHFLDYAWKVNYKPTDAHRSADDLWEKGVQFFKESLWNENDKMFAMGLRNDTQNWVPENRYEIGWVGRNGAVANNLLIDYIRNDSSASLDKGIACLDAWAERVTIEDANEPVDPELEPFIGIWEIMYSNGAENILQIRKDQTVNQSPWGDGNLIWENGVLVCYWSEGPKEEYHVNGSILSVSHWYEGILYPGEGVQIDPGFSSYYGIAREANNLGAAAYEFFRAYDITKQIGINRRKYLDIAMGICDAAVESQNVNGYFDDEVASKGYIGANLIPSLVSAYSHTEDVKYLNAAIAATDYYMNEFYVDGYLWGATLDTNGVDSESSNPLLEGNIRLFELTEDRKYLTNAVCIAYYHASWQIAHSILSPPDSLMDDINYETFGTHVVASLHMCSHAFSLPNFGYLLKLADYTGNDIWRQRAIAMWNSATTGISDGTYTLMERGPRPVGSQDETFCFTDWCLLYASSGNLDTNNPRGSASQWLTAWPTAMRLDILSDGDLKEVIMDIPVME